MVAEQPSVLRSVFHAMYLTRGRLRCARDPVKKAPSVQVLAAQSARIGSEMLLQHHLTSPLFSFLNVKKAAGSGT